MFSPAVLVRSRCAWSPTWMLTVTPARMPSKRCVRPWHNPQEIQTEGNHKSVAMEVRIAYKLSSTCHPRDLWQVFQTIEDWKKWAGDLFGEAGWVHGEPWEQGSRFCIELLYPQRFDLEVLVLKSNAPFEVALLSHGAGLAAEQWIHFSEKKRAALTSSTMKPSSAPPSWTSRRPN